jgi:chromosome partitioning protein
MAKTDSFITQRFTTTEIGKNFNISRREIHEIIEKYQVPIDKVPHGNSHKILLEWKGYKTISDIVDEKEIIKRKVKTFSNAKGGVGKSAHAANFIMECNYRGYKVLAIDLDPQGQLSYNLGINDSTELKTLKDCLNNNGSISENGLKDAILELTPLLSVLPADLTLNNIEIILALKKIGSEKILKTAIDKIEADFDLIVIDTNPYMSLTHANALFAASEILIPSLTDLNSHRGLSYMFSALEEFFPDPNDQPKIRIIPNSYDVRDKISKESMEEMKNRYPNYVTETKIRISTDIRNAAKFQQSIRQHKKQSRAVIDFSELTTEILQ